MGNLLDAPESFFDVVNQRLPGAHLVAFKKNFALSLGSFLLESDHAESLDTYLIFDLNLGWLTPILRILWEIYLDSYLLGNDTDPVHATSLVSIINGVKGERCVEYIHDYYLPYLSSWLHLLDRWFFTSLLLFIW